MDDGGQLWEERDGKDLRFVYRYIYTPMQGITNVKTRLLIHPEVSTSICLHVRKIKRNFVVPISAKEAPHEKDFTEQWGEMHRRLSPAVRSQLGFASHFLILKFWPRL